MPNLEPVVIAGDKYSIRHIGPKAAVWPNSPATPVAVLANTTMVARALPMSALPSSPDLVSGTWTGRLGDNGECALVFPNKEASDGVPWRQRFDPTGHLEFVEIYFNGELDSCCVIDQVSPIDQQHVQIHGSDGWWLLKKAYERDWTVTQAPRDVIARGTQVWVPAIVDNFPAGSFNSQWGSVGTGIAIGTSGGAVYTVPNVGLPVTETLGSNTVTVTSTGVWRASWNITALNLTWANMEFTATVIESSGDTYVLRMGATATNGTVTMSAAGATTVGAFTPSTAYSFMLESDGEWVYGFLNGALIGCLRRGHATTTSLQTTGKLVLPANSPGSVTVGSVSLRCQKTFLMAGSDQGDYVLPGSAATYPVGGLHARYYNDLDLQSAATPLAAILSPTRSQSYGGSAPAEYLNQPDPQINAQNPPGFSQSIPGPGGATLSNWSCRWFGAIYLKLSSGNYTMQFNIPGSATTNFAVRIWIGQTQFGAQLVGTAADNAWSFASGHSTYSFTVSAAALAGTLPYGGGTIARDGWYPIKVEYAVAGSAGAAGALFITNSPASYTDPGGTAIASGAQSTVVPATSLSSLGCVDQRYQGLDHYTLVQQTVQAYGYQASVEPKQLESGLFPGVLAPRIREGTDYDTILAPDNGPRRDGEGILNYSSGSDATDFASSLQGNGAGFQNGNTGQLQGEVFDPPTMRNALFDAQQWQDFSDASFLSLLQALLNSQLGLQLSPWQLLSADPVGRPRKAYTWPLPGTIASKRWRPGDGMRVQARDINVWDTSPRQMLVITRNMLPLGISATQATFTLRPVTPHTILKQRLYQATRWARNNQGQQVSSQGNVQTATLTSGLTDPGSTSVLLLPSDQVIGARLVISENTGGSALHVRINGTDQTTALGGGWAKMPVNLNITAYAVPNSQSQLVVQLQNGASTSNVQYQLLVDVLR